MEMTQEEFNNWESQRLPEIFIEKEHEDYPEFIRRIKINEWDFYGMMNSKGLRARPGGFFLI